ncbi:TetR/AcrR family transcriptional regulator [Pseudactinotalea terrae]|uniref:TetR/AcrR family transcriptional regulator n=1 Tax=Pseudactinotalea terrae TaxID=1743262 RepID=UPI0012E22935|nr:TetR/AcrR family transcriptional regulator [Pseudactinotalea terrae]
MGSREKVLQAAAEMLADDITARLSVRAVAARAGVSTGSLRFHFPTQRDLQEAVLEKFYADLTPGDPIHDTSLPAQERLVRCLQQLLAPIGVGTDARASWAVAYETFLAPEPTEDVRAAFAASERAVRGRIEHWLNVLAHEGSLARSEHTDDAAFLLTVVNGLALDRAMPRGEPSLAAERRALEIAVGAVLA